MSRWDPARSFARDAAVQAVGTLVAAGVVALAATLSGKIRYDARFTGNAVLLVFTAGAFWTVMLLTDNKRFPWWERVLAGAVALIASFILGALLAALVVVTTQRFNG